jgi:hypothetical protein
MRRIILAAFLASLTGCVAPYGDKATLCERDVLCSARPLPDGQNGVEWTPQNGSNRASKPAGSY